MKSITLGITTAALVLCAISCRNVVEEPIAVGTTPIEVDAMVADNTTAPSAVSRVSEMNFDQGDQISFYAVKYDGATANPIGTPIKTYLNNKLYVRNADLFKSWDGTAFVREFFPIDGSAIDIYGIYPYSATAPASFTAFDFEIKADQSKADLSDYYTSNIMMAKKEKIEATAVPNKLIFNHLLAKLIINFKLNGFPAGSAITEVKLLNPFTKATIDLTAYDVANNIGGKVTAVSDRKLVKPAATATSASYDHSYQVILPPQTFAVNSNVIEITLNTANADKYMLTMGATAFDLKSNFEHTFNVQVEFGSLNSIIATGTINPWGTNASSGKGEKMSDNKFVMTLTSLAGGEGNAKWVKVGVNKNRTFTLPATYATTGGANKNPAILFEFAGQGNRPGDYPFTINSLEVFDASLSAIKTKVAISPEISIVASDRSETVAVQLEYNVNGGTIIRK